MGALNIWGKVENAKMKLLL